MGYDKLIDSTQLDTDLTSVANAIRAKSGGNNDLVFPNGFISEIGNLNNIDLSDTTITADRLLEGDIAYLANGNKVIGTGNNAVYTNKTNGINEHSGSIPDLETITFTMNMARLSPTFYIELTSPPDLSVFEIQAKEDDNTDVLYSISTSGNWLMIATNQKLNHLCRPINFVVTQGNDSLIARYSSYKYFYDKWNSTTARGNITLGKMCKCATGFALCMNEAYPG